MFEALCIQLLEESGSKARVHSHSRIHDGSGDLILFPSPPFYVPLKSSVVPIPEARIGVARGELLTTSEDRYKSGRTTFFALVGLGIIDWPEGKQNR